MKIKPNLRNWYITEVNYTVNTNGLSKLAASSMVSLRIRNGEIDFASTILKKPSPFLKLLK